MRYNRLPRKEQWNGVAQLIDNQGKPGDLVILASRGIHLPFKYYYQGSLDHVIVNDYENPEGVIRQLEDAMAGHQRIWLIQAHARRYTAVTALKNLVPQGAIKHFKFVKVAVSLYDIPPYFR
jgi:hypothetical protein